MIKDRGVMKWTSLMLPEHVTHLRAWNDEQHWEKPCELDEQKIEEINEVLVEAMTKQALVQIKYFNESRHRMEVFTGEIKKWDDLSQMLSLVGMRSLTVPITAIQEASLQMD